MQCNALTDRQDKDGGNEEEGEDHPVGCCQMVVVVWNIKS